MVRIRCDRAHQPRKRENTHKTLKSRAKTIEDDRLVRNWENRK